jgi:DNA (cytosine-5)-methyltransferase 1
MRHGSLFSGIGGFDLAAEWMGWENVFHCEWMEFPRKVLEYYWPEADSHIDICKTDFKKYEGTIDLISGGFPCQPFSLAGKRKGTDDERYLWGEMLRAIQEIKPTWVIAENVFGITNIDGGLVFEQVCIDLEVEGYEVQPFIIPAAAKNAPHRRDRCWFIAKNTMHSGCVHGENEQEGAEIWQQRNTCSGNTDGIYLSEGNATHPDSNGQHQCNGNNEINPSEGRINALGNAEQGNGNGNATDTDLSRNTTSESRINKNGQKKSEQWEQSQYEFGRHIQYGWENFPTQSPICGGDDGLPTQLDRITFSKWRNESIKGYGNAICPQIAYELFKIIEHENKSKSTTAQQQDNI